MLKYKIFSFIVFIVFCGKFAASAGLQRDRRQESARDQDDETREPVKYDGAQLWRIPISNEVERNAVAELETKYDGLKWKTVENRVDIMIDKSARESARSYLQNSNITYRILIDDLQKLIEVENPPKEEIELLQNRKGHRLTWKAYHNFNDIVGYLDYLAKTYPDLCSVQTIGTTHEGRALKLLKISNGHPANEAIWIDGGIHAREWISPAVTTYIINHLVENWEELPSYLKNIDWHILPVLNPDGYDYSQKFNRLWRKNRSRNPGSNCRGVDLNRNYGYMWGGEGTSSNPCSEVYRGKGAFSEPETAAVQNFITSQRKGDYFKAFLTFHSYGQYILYPWGYSKAITPDNNDMKLAGTQAATAIRNGSGATYQVGPAAILLYPAAGGSDDWAKGTMGIKYSFTVELRDTGRYGFILPASYIEQSGQEAFNFVDAMARSVTIL
ncbi:unnamed protein product [Hermetia illucens]|uniref:Peptidase M14 domain-containing protein n=1 Tax=Hermetia illucens TaxID=343691 RepID=A0A7R8V1U0_HERIL|nr:carboxypeptidase B-like [Hermetia illucens]CAD7091291.1 unnamed protein product [Hermetia illucens]